MRVLLNVPKCDVVGVGGVKGGVGEEGEEGEEGEGELMLGSLIL